MDVIGGRIGSCYWRVVVINIWSKNRADARGNKEFGIWNLEWGM